MITVDFKDRRPMYVQIIENVRNLIMNGGLLPDEKLPSVRALSLELGINPNTIQRAYTELEHMGVIVTVGGKGVFVTSSTDVMRNEKTNEILTKAKELFAEAGSLGIEKSALQNVLDEAYKEKANEKGGNAE